MEKTEVTFLSTLGKGWTEDMMLLKNGLWQLSEEGEYSFRYYMANSKTKNSMIRRGQKMAKQEFCQRAENIVCVDASLGGAVGSCPASAKKVLMGIPYEYQFKNFMLSQEKRHTTASDTFRQFTHIIVGSTFSEQLFKTSYGVDESKLIRDTALPLAWEMQSVNSESEKKVLMILTSGNAKRTLDKKQFQEFMDFLGEDWTVVTNDPALASNQTEWERLFYIGSTKMKLPMLRCCNVLFTNQASYAAAFIASGKPVYLLSYADNYFERFMNHYYTEMCIKSIADAGKIVSLDGVLSKSQSDFRNSFSYVSSQSPYRAVSAVLG